MRVVIYLNEVLIEWTLERIKSSRMKRKLN